MSFTLVVATRNHHKLREIQSILDEPVTCIGLETLPSAPELIEDADSFAGNATKKAVQLAHWLVATPSAAVRVYPSAPQSATPFVLADDSGLEVDALGGAPGVHSARFAALGTPNLTNSPDSANNQKLMELLKAVPAEKRTARFRCVLALVPLAGLSPQLESPVCAADEFELSTELFEGVCEGRVAFEPSGRGGFGYDPLFIPDGHDWSFAELGPELKDRISHRSKALEKLKRRLTSARG